ncbi:MAG: AbrB/MazE/SpoVT family DNA-binding domain-containing protein [Candidatus Bathyarchaeia archaeon]
MGEITKLNKQTPKSQSLRTTIPFSIIKQFNLTEYDELDWSLAVENGGLVIKVTPIKTGRTE